MTIDQIINAKRNEEPLLVSPDRDVMTHRADAPKLLAVARLSWNQQQQSKADGAVHERYARRLTALANP